MKAIIAKILCIGDRTIQVLLKSRIAPSNEDPRIIPFKNLYPIFSALSPNIRLKGSHRERVISRHIGRLLPGLRHIWHPASGYRNLNGFHRDTPGMRRRIYISRYIKLQLRIRKLQIRVYKFRPALLFVPNFLFWEVKSNPRCKNLDIGRFETRVDILSYLSIVRRRRFYDNQN